MKVTLKKLSLSGLVAAALVIPVTVRAEDAAAAAAPSPVGAELDVPILSSYVWRGQVVNNEPVVQPTMTVTKGGFTFNWWSSFDLTDKVSPDAYEFSEHDITVSYTHPCPIIKGANATLGIVNYDFPNQKVPAPDTREVFFTYSLAELLLQPTLSVYYDFQEADGFYGSLAIGQTESLIKDKLSIQGSASIGASSPNWNNYYYNVQDAAFNDWNVSLSLPYQASSSVTITPSIEYAALIDNKIKDSVKANGLFFGDTDQVIGSLKASITF